VVPDTTIESAVYNAFVGDVAQDLNHPRPIIAGGTAANNADAALVNLKAEKAGQVVTNYDSHVWVAGSFYSAVGATGAPDCVGSAPSAYAYVGTAIIGATNATMLLEAHNISEIEESEDPEAPLIPLDYVREKKDSIWGPWLSPIATLATEKVDRAGDTMTGGLTLSMTSPNINLNKGASGQYNLIFGNMNGANRWLVALGDNIAEAGSNAGSNFVVYRYADNGDPIGQGMQIERANGHASFPAQVSATLFSASGAVTAGTTVTAAGSITSTGGNIRAGAYLQADNGYVYLNAGGTRFIQHTGAQLTSDLGTLWHSGNLTPTALGYLPITGGTVTGAVNFNSAVNINANNTFYVNAPAGGYGVINQTVAGVRQWASGVHPDGYWRLTDNTGTRDRIVLDTASAVSFSGDHLSGIGSLVSTGRVSALGFRCRAGELGAADSPNAFNIFWNGSAARLYMNNTDLGTIYTTALDDPVAELTQKLEKALTRIEALEARQPKEN
jgi:hypothetical protein